MGDEIYLADRENYTPYDVGRDGRFLMARQVRRGAAQATPLIVMENWFEELRQRTAGR